MRWKAAVPMVRAFALASRPTNVAAVYSIAEGGGARGGANEIVVIVAPAVSLGGFKLRNGL